jgi:nucleoside-diphosphate-sugar epimerase
MPVLTFPRDLLRDEFELVVHMIAMGEMDMQAAVRTFAGHAARLVALSSGDVYRAYGRFTGLEPGPLEEGLLHEDSPVRETLYPYRAQAASTSDVNYYYEKILVERALLGQTRLPGTVLRLPKVYGPAGNANLATIYGYQDRPGWRWTHGYVENVSAAIVLASLHPVSVNRVYNVGEAYTPTIAERLELLPSRTPPQIEACDYDFQQNIVYDTTRIRRELGYAEPVSYEDGLARTLRGAESQR